MLPDNFWNFNINDLDDFGSFYTKASQKIQSFLPKEIDERKQRLFELAFASNGEMNIKEFLERVAWSERLVNRYSNQQFGISLKAYCNLLRF